MKTIAIGFPLGIGRFLRSGTIIQPEDQSAIGKDYISYQNEVLPSDSGGALFVVEDGNMKLAAISTQIMRTPIAQTFTGIVAQYLNINCGLKISSIVKDMEDQLKSGKLDKKRAAEVKNFLKLNKV